MADSCPKLQSEIDKQKQLGAGKFGVVKTWKGDHVVKIEQCDKIEFKKHGFIPDVERRIQILRPVVAAGLTPKITGKMMCGNKCISFYKRVHGETLSDALKKSSRERSIQLIKKAISAIESLHNLLPANVSHGDLHTANIMITNKGSIKIIDFAIEREIPRFYDWKFFNESVREDAVNVPKQDLDNLLVNK